MQRCMGVWEYKGGIHVYYMQLRLGDKREDRFGKGGSPGRGGR